MVCLAVAIVTFLGCRSNGDVLTKWHLRWAPAGVFGMVMFACSPVPGSVACCPDADVAASAALGPGRQYC